MLMRMLAGRLTGAGPIPRVSTGSCLEVGHTKAGDARTTMTTPMMDTNTRVFLPEPDGPAELAEESGLD